MIIEGNEQWRSQALDVLLLLVYINCLGLEFIISKFAEDFISALAYYPEVSNRLEGSIHRVVEFAQTWQIILMQRNLRDDIFLGRMRSTI